MARLTASLVAPILLFGCTDTGVDQPAVTPEAVSTQEEELYQNREALLYGLDQLDREAEARSSLGLPIPDESQRETGARPTP